MKLNNNNDSDDNDDDNIMIIKIIYFGQEDGLSALCLCICMRELLLY